MTLERSVNVAECRWNEPVRRPLVVVALCLLLAACGSQPRRPVVERGETALPAPATQSAGRPAAAAQKPASLLKRGGGFYQDDGPGENLPPPEFLEAIPDAEPKLEPLNRFANKPYAVLGRDYVPMTSFVPYKAIGIASWYGRKFHGQKTSSGETYDMYGMTAAHATLPIPSYVRVTNPSNGKSVVVRVNDRGPFLGGRLIDLSYAAAWKLGYVGNGSSLVEVESVKPGVTLLAAKTFSTMPAPELNDPLANLIQSVEQTAATSQAPAPLPELTDVHGIFLQLGAFGNPDNAESLRSHLARELSGLPSPTDLSEKLVVQARAGIYRVQLGPWQDHAEAQRIAELLRDVFEVKPVVVRQ